MKPDNASIIFERPAPVKLRSPEREERTEDLMLRISMGTSKTQQGVRTLRVQIYSEEDPYFLHSLDISEEDFQNLKVDQGILVDFGAFPGKLIELVEACIAAGTASEAPKFSSVLSIRGGDSVFQVIETNQFKHLPHLTLAFRPGNDAAIKSHLATRLAEVKDERAELQARLRAALASLEAAEREAEARGAELVSDRARHAAELSDIRDQLVAQTADSRERAMAEISALKDKLEGERRELEARLREQLQSVSKRNEELEGSNRALMEQKYKLDSRVSELSSRLGVAEGEVKALRDAADRLQSQNGRIDVERAEQSRSLTDLKVSVTTLEQKVRDRDELVAELRTRLEETEGSRRALDTAMEDLRRALGLAEERLAATSGEVAKGNQIIERLQAEVRAGRAKAKLKAAVISQQEAILTERQSALEKALTDTRRASEEADAARKDKESLQRRVEEQKRKLEESQALLQSNQQMIQWLNSQVTEAQLGKFSPAASRYSFRPATAPRAGAAPPLGGVGGSGSPPSAAAAVSAPLEGLAPRTASAASPVVSLAGTSSAASAGGYVPGKYAAQYRVGGVAAVGQAGAAAPAAGSAAGGVPTPSAFLPGPAAARS